MALTCGRQSKEDKNARIRLIDFGIAQDVIASVEAVVGKVIILFVLSSFVVAAIAESDYESSAALQFRSGYMAPELWTRTVDEENQELRVDSESIARAMRTSGLLLRMAQTNSF